MAARSSSTSSYKFQALANALYRYRVAVSIDRHQLAGSKCLSSISSSRAYSVNKANEQGQIPDPPKPGFSSWMKWLLGSALTMLVSLWKNKWKNLPRLEGEVERVVEDVEVVAQVIDEVETTADKALTELANRIPDDQNQLKHAVESMERVSNIAAKDAQQVENIIHKVGDVKQDLQELETMVEPVVEKVKNKLHRND